MKRNRIAKKFISAALSTTIAVSAAAQLCITPVLAAGGTGTSDEPTGSYIQNGSFEAPKVNEVVSNYKEKITAETDSGDMITYRNTGWMVTSEQTFNDVSNDQFFWHTTASDNRVEIVKASETENEYFPAGTDHTAAHGDQFAEIIAEEESSLYQNINTDPGSTLTWAISHRARIDTPDSGKNSMAVFIGPKQEDIGKHANDENDIFKQMAMLLYTNFDNLNVGVSKRAVELYSIPLDSDREEPITAASVSTVKSDIHSQEWFCWIVTSDTLKWYEYADTYEVPSDQTESTLAFAALNGGTDGQEYINAGNLIDDVRFGIMYPLNVSTTPGGTGAVEYINDDLQSEDSVTLDNSPYIKNFEGNIEVTVKAVPEDGHKFMGALIDGDIINANNTKFFKPVGDGSYTLNLTMNQAHHVVLFYALTGKVVYAPNGGTFDKAAAGYETVDYGVQKVYTSTDNESTVWSLRQTYAPENNGKSFIGWRVISDGDVKVISGNNAETNYDGEFIPAEHNIVCDENDDGTFTYMITYSEDGTDKKIKAISTDRTLLLVAEYLNSLTVQPCYAGVDGETEHNDSAGGTATVSAGTESNELSVDLYAGEEYRLKAVPNTGYEFKGWYMQNGDDPNDVTIIPSANESYSANFSPNENVIIHALFVEIATTPEVAVVAQDEEAKKALEAKDIKNTITGFTDGYGRDLYGNTISTSFTLTRDFSGYTTDDIGGVWTVVLPTLGTYMKVSENDGVNYQYIDKNDPVVEDKDVKYNSGTIYGTQEGLNTADQFQFYVGSGTTLSGGNVRFGLVIDNVYAPNATAGFKVTDIQSGDVKELDNTNSIYTKNTAGKDDYVHKEDILSGNSNAVSE